MRKVIYITIYLLIGLYIAWDQTILLDIDSAPKVEEGHYGWDIDSSNHFPEYLRTRYPEDIQDDWKTVESRIALLYNQDSIIPYKNIGGKRYHVLTIGESLPVFEHVLRKYSSVTSQNISISEIRNIKPKVYDHLIIAFNGTRNLSPEDQNIVRNLIQEPNATVVNFGSLEILTQLGKTAVWLQAYEGDEISQSIAAQILFGGIGVNAQIPIISGLNQVKLVGETTSPTRLSYVPSEYFGIERDSLSRIGKIVEEGIQQYAMPGCQILIAKSGKVLFDHSFGYHTYDQRRAVKNSDIYDLASVTKVAATTMAAMKVYDEGLLNLNAPLNAYLKQKTSWTNHSVQQSDTVKYLQFLANLTINSLAGIDNSNNIDTVRYQDSLMIVTHTKSRVGKYNSPIMKVKIKDLLTHRSGLQPSLPMPASLRKGSAYKEYKATKAANWVLLPHNYEDTLWNMTRNLEVKAGGYQYSDVNMMLMHQAIDSLTHTSLNRYLFENIYYDLGLQTMSYNPLQIYELERIVPTERSTSGGKQFLQGVVHDPIARLSGGVAGHAGLFSNSNDLAILMQMLLNEGQYGGKQFLDPYTVRRFTHSGKSFRGLGFNTALGSAVHARSASLKTYGHTGFTGTCVWVDPEHELVFVFLSNRVHPTSLNNRIAELQIRERVHQVIYDELGIDPPIRKTRKPAPIIASNIEEEEVETVSSITVASSSTGR